MKKPRGHFEFQSSGKTITGRFCTASNWAYCQKKGGLTIQQLFEIITNSLTIETIAEMLLSAVEVIDKENKYSISDAMDWIDDLGGVIPAMELINDSMTADIKENGSKKKARN